jgi:hypothetical protein
VQKPRIVFPAPTIGKDLVRLIGSQIDIAQTAIRKTGHRNEIAWGLPTVGIVLPCFDAARA